MFQAPANKGNRVYSEVLCHAVTSFRRTFSPFRASVMAWLLLRACSLGFADRLRLKCQFRFDTLYEFLNLVVFAVLRAQRSVCLLVRYAHSFPQVGRDWLAGAVNILGLKNSEPKAKEDKLRPWTKAASA